MIKRIEGVIKIKMLTEVFPNTTWTTWTRTLPRKNARKGQKGRLVRTPPEMNHVKIQ
jgi:hypothetical protein